MFTLIQTIRNASLAGPTTNPVANENQNGHVIGYFGASSNTIDRGLDPNRPLYFGNKATAQGYAERRAQSEGGTPVVAELVAKHTPRMSDLQPGQFEGYDPISPQGQQRMGIAINNVEEVTPQNRLGLVGIFQRTVYGGGGTD